MARTFKIIANTSSMSGKHLPTSTRAYRPGIPGFVPRNPPSKHSTSSDQRAYVELTNEHSYGERFSASNSPGTQHWPTDQRGSLSVGHPACGSITTDETIVNRFPSSAAMHGFWNCSPSIEHNGTIQQRDAGVAGILRGHNRILHGENLPHPASQNPQSVRVCYDLAYEGAVISPNNPSCDLEGRGVQWRTPLADEVPGVAPALGLASAGYCSGVGGTGNTAISETTYTGIDIPKPLAQVSGSKECSWGYNSTGYYESPEHSPSPGQQTQVSSTESIGQIRPQRKRSHGLESIPSKIPAAPFKCDAPGCNGKFKRHEHLKRHLKSHTNEKPHVCWVPDCNRSFSRNDNLNVHYATTHGKKGGRNRYVATLDEASSEYDPDFRGDLTPDGRPVRCLEANNDTEKHVHMR
ncbi:uncharacterized protein PADG_06618 [Paracoccidioides brasiliensis Pb18]|uniref:C2H2-type domain-containing protein n=1 Tax=Paracoccidioides brasiliensis (strain Pb18) TaxID=502780 RepID=C1GH82_PARBD|nr:uncharacterized protein PADG_06618 [Paracoccidioides brasiliensis Pb18]EEH50539.1 hypothetical protein PADG_06618 [Paracoccidioides brasiliensis Pb18]